MNLETNNIHAVKKATGIDFIPNEVFKCQEISQLLCVLFNACFRNHLVPSSSGKAMITIPKGANKDPFVPLN